MEKAQDAVLNIYGVQIILRAQSKNRGPHVSYSDDSGLSYVGNNHRKRYKLATKMNEKLIKLLRTNFSMVSCITLNN